MKKMRNHCWLHADGSQCMDLTCGREHAAEYAPRVVLPPDGNNAFLSDPDGWVIFEFTRAQTQLFRAKCESAERWKLV